jgi:hypothetical protein
MTSAPGGSARCSRTGRPWLASQGLAAPARAARGRLGGRAGAQRCTRLQAFAVSADRARPWWLPRGRRPPVPASPARQPGGAVVARLRFGGRPAPRVATPAAWPNMRRDEVPDRTGAYRGWVIWRVAPGGRGAATRSSGWQGWLSGAMAGASAFCPGCRSAILAGSGKQPMSKEMPACRARRCRT